MRAHGTHKSGAPHSHEPVQIVLAAGDSTDFPSEIHRFGGQMIALVFHLALVPNSGFRHAIIGGCCSVMECSASS